MTNYQNEAFEQAWKTVADTVRCSRAEAKYFFIAGAECIASYSAQQLSDALNGDDMASFAFDTLTAINAAYATQLRGESK